MADQRGRGRSRSRATAMAAPTRRPGEQQQATTAAAPGRGGVGRQAWTAPAPIQAQAQQPPARAADVVAAPAPTASAWGKKPEPAAAPPAKPSITTMKVVEEACRSEATSAVEQAEAGLAQMSLQSGGGEGYRSTRGAAVRGKRGMEVQVRSRPQHAINTKQGSSGDTVKLQANYFPIISTPQWVINQYHVDFSPDIDNNRIRRSLFNVHRSLFGRCSFEGNAVYSMERLPNNEMELFSVRESDGARIKINVKFIREIPPNDPVVLQVLGIQMRRNLRHLEMVQVRDLYYDAKDPKMIPDFKMELWPGYVTAIHQHEEAPLLCADLTFKVLRTDTVWDLFNNCYNKVGPSQFKDEAVKQLLGNVVMTKYNNRTYRIDDVDFKMNPKQRFKLRDGSETTYVDYYFNHYGIRIKDAEQPMLVSRPKKRDLQAGQPDTPIVLVPELCTMTGINEETRNNYKAMAAMAEYTRAAPSNRVQCIKSLLQRINSNQTITTEMAEWNLKFSSDLLQLNGRQLPTVKIHGGRNVEYSYDPKVADWTREMRSSVLYSTCNVTNWLVIVTERDQHLANDFLEAMRRVCRTMGIGLERPEIVTIRSGRIGDYLKELNERYSRSLQFVMFFCPDKSKDRYNALKKVCCIERPISSQVITINTIRKPQMHMSVATKVAIQVNCKMGGAAWAVPIPLSKTMVIGYDSYHDSSMRGRSVGAVCCSLDKNFTRYHSQTTLQTSHQELVSGLTTHIISGMKRYKELNGELPDKIFIYRDGVGEGQLDQIFNFEVKQVLECFKIVGHTPALAFIVVTKRINTRLFLKNARNNDILNPNPGTVVDSAITRPEWYDFFLVSQSVRQGTVTPTHYNIIYDKIGLTPDIMQMLTYRLCHLYYNWPGTLRVPAPCAYAHKLAFLTGQHLHNSPSSELADLLYYL